jgi:hypothetical protein
MNNDEPARGDDDLERGIKTLVVEATRDTPRMTPEQVAVRAAAERKAKMERIYRRSPGLYEAVSDIARRVRKKHEHRQFLRRILPLLCILAVCFVFAVIEDTYT